MKRLAVTALAAALVSVGCTEATPLFCDGTTAHACTNPRFPTCDVAHRVCVPNGTTNNDMAVCSSGSCDAAVPDLHGSDGLQPPTDGSMPSDMSSPDMQQVKRCNRSSDCTNPNAPICDTGTNMCRACSGSADDSACSSRTAGLLCLTEGTNKGQCGACRTATNYQSANCTASPLPVCSTAGVCVACTNDDQCNSRICNADGSCQSTSSVLIVDVDTCGGTAMNGTLAAPFCQVNDAVAHVSSAQPIIRVIGSTTAYSPAAITAKTVTIRGPLDTPTAVLAGNAANPALNITAGANVTVQSMEIMSQVGALDGIDCATSTLTVLSSSIHNTGKNGVTATSCPTTISSSNISHNAGVGVAITSATTTTANLAADTISYNTGGGISLSNISFTVVNSLLSTNSGTATVFAGNSTGLFWFNTIVNNTATSSYGAFKCASATQAVLLQASIIRGNTKVSGLSYDGGNCVFSYVDTDDTPMPASPEPPTTSNTNIGTDPLFVNATTNFSLQSTSPAKNLVTVSSGGLFLNGQSLPTTDIVGTARPRAGGGYDIGAYQAVP